MAMTSNDLTEQQTVFLKINRVALAV